MTDSPRRLARLAPLVFIGLLSACSMFHRATTDDAGLDPAHLPPPDVLYSNGVTQMQKGYEESAVKTFDEVEQNYPYSTWATHAQLMHGYAQYKNQNYDDAINALDRFIALHPDNDNIAYAYYLKALCYYEQIEDVQRDQTSTYEAIQTLTDVTNRFPDTAYARDARIKLRLAQNRLAGQDMTVGRYYEEQHLYGAAIGRFQDVVNTYQTTTYVPEALERLTETYLDIGLTGAAQRTASVLAYNYPGSPWYQAAYAKLRAHGLLTSTPGQAPKSSGGGFLGIF